MFHVFIFFFFCSAAAKTNPGCGPFPHAILENGRILVAGGDKLRFKCNAGFFLASPPQVRCWKGNWTSIKEPTCLQSEGVCEDPPAIANGVILGSERIVGSVIQYMCNPGHLILGEGRRECLQSGHWSSLTPACIDEREPLQKLAERLKSKFVTDLTQHSINESGPEGRLLDPDSLHHGLELVILIDRSSSVDPHDFKIGIDFVKFLLQEFGVRNGGQNTTGTRAAVFAFGTEVDILFNLDNNTITGPVAANRALDTLQAGGGGTAMESALTYVFTHLSEVREKAKKAIFLMTDGEPNIGNPGITPEDVARELKVAGGFEIFTMGIGRSINRKLLSSLASEPLLSHVFIVDKYSDLRKIIKMIRDTPNKTKRVSPERCGYIQGEDLYLKKWPWLAAIYISHLNGSLSFCTGSLICNDWVLTAASCFQPHTQGVFVTMGERNLVQQEPFKLNFYATQTVLHPNFNPNNSLQHNLALLKLNKAVPLKKFRPICLPPTDRTVPLHMDLSINASITGWGLETSSVFGIRGDTIRFSNRSTVMVELGEQLECKRITGRAYTENILCAGFGKQTCAGDMGSPIVALDPFAHFHHVLGVLSGKTKCSEGFNQYTQLIPYIQWIHKVTHKCHIRHWKS